MRFTIDTIPFGIISTKENPNSYYIATAFDNYAINLHTLHHHDALYNEKDHPGVKPKSNERDTIFEAESLNEFISFGKPFTEHIRKELQQRIRDGKIVPEAKVPLEDVMNHLPVHVGDYTDFYASKEHATNLGKMFRPTGDSLLPNWSHIPVGYHGRSSSIIVSGTEIHYPSGMILLPDNNAPVYQKCRKLDYELELGFVIGKDSQWGKPVTMEEAENHIFGVVILNDWSARDIQKYEYVPLGPFLGKNFATTISAWVVPIEAFSDYRCKQVAQDPPPQPHLSSSDVSTDAFDIDLSVDLIRAGERISLTKTNSKGIYWSIRQMITHHTSNGCNLRTGDILATGTISGDNHKSVGSMLEMSEGKWDKLLLTGDEILMYGSCGDGKV